MELLLDIGYHHYCYHQYCHHHNHHHHLHHRLQQLSSVGVQGGGRRCESHKNYLPAEARQSTAERSRARGKNTSGLFTRSGRAALASRTRARPHQAHQGLTRSHKHNLKLFRCSGVVLWALASALIQYLGADCVCGRWRHT